jgi:hypothetical protein
MDSVQGTRALPRVGFPIRKSPDQRSFSSSPRLIAAVHVLHRPLMPRHPPCALVLLTFVRLFVLERTPLTAMQFSRCARARPAASESSHRLAARPSAASGSHPVRAREPISDGQAHRAPAPVSQSSTAWASPLRRPLAPMALEDGGDTGSTAVSTLIPGVPPLRPASAQRPEGRRTPAAKDCLRWSSATASLERR